MPPGRFLASCGIILKETHKNVTGLNFATLKPHKRRRSRRSHLSATSESASRVDARCGTVFTQRTSPRKPPPYLRNPFALFASCKLIAAMRRIRDYERMDNAPLCARQLRTSMDTVGDQNTSGVPIQRPRDRHYLISSDLVRINLDRLRRLVALTNRSFYRDKSATGRRSNAMVKTASCDKRRNVKRSRLP